MTESEKKQINEICRAILEAKSKLMESSYEHDYFNAGYQSSNIDMLLNLMMNGYYEYRKFNEIMDYYNEAISKGYKKDAH